jgi:hypothetical protein
MSVGASIKLVAARTLPGQVIASRAITDQQTPVAASISIISSAATER